MNRPGVTASLVAVALLAGCGDPPTGPRSPSGSLVVSVNTTGGGFDVDGYTAVLDDTIQYALDVNEGVVFGLHLGTHRIGLKGVAPNCSPTDALERAVTLSLSTDTVRFSIACSAPAELAGIRVLFSDGRPGTIRALNADGSGSVALGTGSWPELSPDLNRIAFTRRPDVNQCDLWVMNSDGTDARLLARESCAPDWSPDGRSLVVSGAEGLGGTLQLIPAQGGVGRELTSVPAAEDAWPRFSPDGTRIAFTRGGDLRPEQVWVMNADGSGSARQVTTSIQWAVHPVWAPEGRRIAFEMGDGIAAMQLDSGVIQGLLEKGPTRFAPSDWSGDGALMLLTGTRGVGLNSRSDVYLFRLSDRALWRLTGSGTPKDNPTFWETTARAAAVR